MVYGPKAEEANTGIYQSKQCAELGFIIKDGYPYKSRPYDLFLSEEVHFLKAELYARGFIAGDAKSEYEAGVRASFATWGVTSEVDDYLTSTEKMRLVQVLDMMINKVREIQLWKRSLLRNISLGYLIWRKKVGMINVV